MIVAVAGPTCAGKDTLIELLMERNPDLHLSVSVTTRPRGKDERKTYRHVSAMKFTQMIQNKEFAEYEEIGGEFYGTPHSELPPGRDVIRNINYQGALTLKQELDDVRLVFILPPSYGVMAARSHQRGRENSEKIGARLMEAVIEIRKVSLFDAWFVNDELERAFEDFEMLIRCFRCGYVPNPQIFRNPAVLGRVQATFPTPQVSLSM